MGGFFGLPVGLFLCPPQYNAWEEFVLWIG